MSQFLKKIYSTSEAPSESYLLYHLEGGIFYIYPKDYPAFILQWVGSTKLPPVTMDLCSIRAHSLILDLDYKLKGIEISADILEVIEAALKITFIPNVPNFTYIIAARKNSAGIHIHLPEFIIGYDDYIIFCECLQYKIQSLLKDKKSYTLDILKNVMLIGASKPNTEPYRPIKLVFVDETNSISVDLQNKLDSKLSFKRLKNNEKSLFRYLLNCTSNSLPLQLKYVMMPVVINFQPYYNISYHTTIANTQSDNLTVVAAFTNIHTKDVNYITKNKNLTVNGSQFLSVYYYLKLNAPRIVELNTNNYAISQWYKKFHIMPTNNSHIPERFLDIHSNLQLDNSVFADDPNPIKSILEYNDGYYFLPVFYTFCQYFQTTPANIVQDLFHIVDTKYHPLLLRIQELNDKTIDYGVTDLTLNTLYFCANNLYNRPKTMKEKLKLILDDNKRSILSVTTHGQMIELLRNIQEKHFPIRVLKLRNALKKPTRYIWNFLSESWQETQPGEITDHLFNLWTTIKIFLIHYKKSGGTGGPDDNIVEKFNVNTVVSAIMSDTALERKDILMDTHKWFIRLQDGTLHLLTGHIGGVVPEFFLSDRKIGIELSRQEMMMLCNESPSLENLYHSMTNRSFFLKYLKALFMDDGENFYFTLQLFLSELESPLMTSMMHFYINLCKYASFEYDTMMYLLDVLASVLIATNYERKFFVLKGLTRNGKSKLFELMGRILGGYYHSIQSENLTPSHSTNTATPELASTLFSCRMVASEELEGKLHENRVKQITGNSFVTFRNMYEQNSGGIPTAKLFATTNNYPECNASEAFKDRVVAIPFDAVFADNVPSTTSEQLITNTFAKSSYVVEESYQGGFFILYYHLKHNINKNDGLLYYRPEPASVIEFTEDYLIHADIYVQFKIHMDVQIVTGCMTTMNDVKSAVRQFLKGTKNTSFHETDLFMRFEEEFGEYRRTDIQLNSFNYVSMADKSASTLQFESESLSDTSKKVKRDGAFFVYYESVVIKNMKRTNLDT